MVNELESMHQLKSIQDSVAGVLERSLYDYGGQLQAVSARGQIDRSSYFLPSIDYGHVRNLLLVLLQIRRRSCP